MLVFVDRGKPEYSDKNFSEQEREPNGLNAVVCLSMVNLILMAMIRALTTGDGVRCLIVIISPADAVAKFVPNNINIDFIYNNFLDG